MVKEIERKFLVSDAAWRQSATVRIRIRQFYLAITADRSVRVRIADGAASLGLKFGSGVSRDEFEFPIPLAEAEALAGFALGRVIKKTRHHVRHSGRLYEVDVFGGQLAGLVIAELETAEPVPADQLPGWLGREVTGQSRFSNASLCVGEVPEVAA